MNKYLTAAFLLLGAAATACGPSAGTPVEHARACDAENDGKYIEVAGYLNDKGGIFCSNIGGGPVKCGLKLLGAPADAAGFSADIVAGSGANNIEKPASGYKKEDLKIRDNGGNLLAVGDKVKLTGKIHSTKDPVSNATVCYLTVDKIDKTQ